jgi:hypothetical protein
VATVCDPSTATHRILAGWGTEEQNAKRLGDPVDRITVHPLDNSAGLLDRVDDHRKPRGQKHGRRSRARGVRRPRNGDAAVGQFQSRGIVHAVAGHAHEVAAPLKDIDDLELVFWKYLSETVGTFDGLRGTRRYPFRRVPQLAGIQNVGAHS